MEVTKQTIKLRADFKTRNDLVDYLMELCEIDLKRELVYGRIGRGIHPFDAITMPKVSRPGANHPYKRQYAQRLTDEKNCEHGKALDDYCKPCGRIHGGGS